MAIARLEDGNDSNVKSVGGGVLELRIHARPGHRVYFGRDRDDVILLLCLGTKSGQQKDIERARGFWRDYKERKQ